MPRSSTSAARCTQCRREPAHPKYNGLCEGCHRYAFMTAFNTLPSFPQVMQNNATSKRCHNCDLWFLENLIFRDSRGIQKCVVCLKWDLLNGVEQHPGIQMTRTNGGKPIVCIACEQKFDAKDFMVHTSGSTLERISMFCKKCRHLEERWIHQGLANIEY